jgi:K+-sensing histidine kinase KdpD
METFFASPERADSKKLQSQNTLFKNNETLVNITDSVSQMLVVLNKERQIIYANKQFCELLSLSDSEYLGKRPGEALNCIHSTQTTGGCGTTEFCSKCGAVNAILESQHGVKSVKECRISAINNDALDLKVSATPYTMKGEVFTIFVITDISNEKKRQILERVFFHDVLNSAGGISGLSSILPDIEDPNEVSELAGLIHHASEHLIDEIRAQRQLSAAENGELELDIKDFETISLLQQMADLYSKHEITQGKYISIDKNSEKFSFKTDPTLLKRVIGNMLKNALEASLPGSTVVLSAVKKGDSALFSVHNQNYIERDAQLQLFKRSFTTKGVGRGLGTYSMKLFGEKYLKGKVWFESKQTGGTTFFIELPANGSNSYYH